MNVPPLTEQQKQRCIELLLIIVRPEEPDWDMFRAIDEAQEILGCKPERKPRKPLNIQ